jgi:mannose-6-phosphate isomerase-like protein (cupin superfamily)
MKAAAETIGVQQKFVSGFGTEITVTLTGHDSSGAIGLFEAVVPAGNAPPLHIHHAEDEIHHIIEGTYEFWLDGQSLMRSAGESIFLPRGVPHTFRVVGDVPGKNLAIIIPGGSENFFVEVAERGLTFPKDLPQLAEIGARYRMEFIGPAPWAKKPYP